MIIFAPRSIGKTTQIIKIMQNFAQTRMQTKQNQPKTKQNKIWLDEAKHGYTDVCGAKEESNQATKQNSPIFIEKKFLNLLKFFYSLNLDILLGCLVLIDRKLFKPP